MYLLGWFLFSPYRNHPHLSLNGRLWISSPHPNIVTKTTKTNILLPKWMAFRMILAMLTRFPIAIPTYSYAFNDYPYWLWWKLHSSINFPRFFVKILNEVLYRRTSTPLFALAYIGTQQFESERYLVLLVQLFMAWRQIIYCSLTISILLLRTPASNMYWY